MKRSRLPRHVAPRRRRLRALLLALTVIFIQGAPGIALGYAGVDAALAAESPLRDASTASAMPAAMHCHQAIQTPVPCEHCRHPGDHGTYQCQCQQGCSAPAVLPSADATIGRAELAFTATPRSLPRNTTVAFAPPLRPPPL